MTCVSFAPLQALTTKRSPVATKRHIGIVFDTRLAPSLCCLGNILYPTRDVDEVTCSNRTFLQESRVTLAHGIPVTPSQGELAVMWWGY